MNHMDGITAPESAYACPTASRRRRQSGQALVEFAIVLPLFLFVLGGGFTMWQGLHGSVNLTSGVRAGVLVASSDLRNRPSTLTPPTAADLATATADTVNAINAEEGVVNKYSAAATCTANCVTLALVKGSLTGTDEVTVSVHSRVAPAIPGLPTLSVFATATASFES